MTLAPGIGTEEPFMVLGTSARYPSISSSSSSGSATYHDPALAGGREPIVSFKQLRTARTSAEKEGRCAVLLTKISGGADANNEGGSAQVSGGIGE